MSAPLLALEAASRHFARAGVTALRAASIGISLGEMVAVVGRSGSGKSTLLNILGLLDRPSEGTYYIDGVDSATLSTAQLTALRGAFFGFVFQKAHLLPNRTARENVELALLPRRDVTAAARRDRADVAMAQLGVAHRANAFPGTLSGGEAQRIAFARALVQAPRVLLCDEPTGSLDSQTGAEVVELLHEVHRAGSTVVLVTHDGELAETLPRRIELSDGEVLRDVLNPALRLRCD